MAKKQDRRILHHAGDDEVIEVEITQLGATVGKDLFLRMLQILGPSAEELFAGFDRATGAAAIDFKSLGKSVAILSKTLTDDDLDYVCNTLMKTTLIRFGDGDFLSMSKSVFDQVFAGRYFEVFEWIYYGMELNYKGFFSALAAKGFTKLPVAAKAA